MARFNPFSPNIEVVSNLQQEDFLPTRVTEAIAKRLQDSAKSKIIGRVGRGKFPGNPDGSGPLVTKSYSRKDSVFPLTRVGERSPIRKSLYEQRGARVYAAAQQGRDGLRAWRSKAGNPWVYVAGGYARFRRLAGLQNRIVDLSFTGKLLDDLRVRSSIKTYRNQKTAAFRFAGQQIGKSTKIASFLEKAYDFTEIAGTIELEIGFATQSSWRIARFQHERYGNIFAVLTPNEARELRLEGAKLAQIGREKYGTEDPSFSPRSESGAFIKVTF